MEGPRGVDTRAGVDVAQREEQIKPPITTDAYKNIVEAAGLPKGELDHAHNWFTLETPTLAIGGSDEAATQDTIPIPARMKTFLSLMPKEAIEALKALNEQNKNYTNSIAHAIFLVDYLDPLTRSVPHSVKEKTIAECNNALLILKQLQGISGASGTAGATDPLSEVAATHATAISNLIKHLESRVVQLKAEENMESRSMIGGISLAVGGIGALIAGGAALMLGLSAAFAAFPITWAVCGVLLLVGLYNGGKWKSAKDQQFQARNDDPFSSISNNYDPLNFSQNLKVAFQASSPSPAVDASLPPMLGGEKFDGETTIETFLDGTGLCGRVTSSPSDNPAANLLDALLKKDDSGKVATKKQKEATARSLLLHCERVSKIIRMRISPILDKDSRGEINLDVNGLSNLLDQMKYIEAVGNGAMEYGQHWLQSITHALNQTEESEEWTKSCSEYRKKLDDRIFDKKQYANDEQRWNKEAKDEFLVPASGGLIDENFAFHASRNALKEGVQFFHNRVNGGSTLSGARDFIKKKILDARDSLPEEQRNYRYNDILLQKLGFELQRVIRDTYMPGSAYRKGDRDYAGVFSEDEARKAPDKNVLLLENLKKVFKRTAELRGIGTLGAEGDSQKALWTKMRQQRDMFEEKNHKLFGQQGRDMELLWLFSKFPDSPEVGVFGKVRDELFLNNEKRLERLRQLDILRDKMFLYPFLKDDGETLHDEVYKQSFLNHVDYPLDWKANFSDRGVDFSIPIFQGQGKTLKYTNKGALEKAILARHQEELRQLKDTWDQEDGASAGDRREAAANATIGVGHVAALMDAAARGDGLGAVVAGVDALAEGLDTEIGSKSAAHVSAKVEALKQQVASAAAPAGGAGAAPPAAGSTWSEDDNRFESALTDDSIGKKIDAVVESLKKEAKGFWKGKNEAAVKDSSEKIGSAGDSIDKEKLRKQILNFLKAGFSKAQKDADSETCNFSADEKQAIKREVLEKLLGTGDSPGALYDFLHGVIIDKVDEAQGTKNPLKGLLGQHNTIERIAQRAMQSVIWDQEEIIEQKAMIESLNDLVGEVTQKHSAVYSALANRIDPEMKAIADAARKKNEAAFGKLNPVMAEFAKKMWVATIFAREGSEEPEMRGGIPTAAKEWTTSIEGNQMMVLNNKGAPTTEIIEKLKADYQEFLDGLLESEDE